MENVNAKKKKMLNLDYIFLFYSGKIPRKFIKLSLCISNLTPVQAPLEGLPCACMNETQYSNLSFEQIYTFADSKINAF